ncbi:MAG: putative Signal transduction response regulator, receiver and diguanylate cyclase domain [Myxococcaceae bacterium]|nr:putative Signal transduction response regulator, receiver and diguanylate cyclase domain [Myxococcaceae bacterium]
MERCRVTESVVRVLLLEDDAVDRLVFVRALHRSTGQRFEVHSVDQLTALAGAVEQVRPDVVVIDLNLPDSRGLDTFLEARRYLGRLPCVVLTGLDDRRLGALALQQGAQDFLVKGEFSPALLERALTHSIARSQLVDVVASAALHDELTGLPNRALFSDRAQTALRRAARQSETIALVFVDLDRFKPINDKHGHHVGDAVLCEVASRLRAGLRASDTVARWGGDEFVCLLENTVNLAAARGVAAKLHRALIEPMRFEVAGGGVLEITSNASLGLSYFPDHGQTADELLRCCDAAMYAAKQAGGGVVTWGSDGMRALRRAPSSGVVLSSATTSTSASSAMLTALGAGRRD